MSRDKIRIESYKEHYHKRQDSVVDLLIRETKGRKQTWYDIREVNISVSNRQPNVDNVILYNLERAIKDLIELKDDIINNELYKGKEE